MTLLRDLIDIPERVQTNDFVLKLSDGVTAEGAASTISNYVVTPQLAKAFDHALGLIQGAITSRRSAASYLHGSFGSGKSHFMAVLNLLLAGSVQARAITELADTVHRQDAWLPGKKFLMVPFHMIGARDVESAILGGYADHVRRMHPKAPTPGFYLGERLFDDARRLRTTLGDAAFFGKLNEHKANAGDGWGDFGATWDASSFDAATLEPPEGEERQRLVGDLIGDHQAGALEVRFIDTLKYWEARFDRINLEDRNMPVIAEKRLLKPKSLLAKEEMDTAFETFARSRSAVLDILLGSDGERDWFRKTYPFSPALVQALIAASSVLQRERTALKLMLTLLVKRRDELRLGMLIPVGDLWDEISAGDQPFSDGMRIEFENAKKLWTQKLLPLLEQEHDITWQDLQEKRADPQRARLFENDARLLKTLLLAALVPEVAALRALTAPRLAALNHGSVVSPVVGREGSLVLAKLRGWAARVSEDTVPIVSLQISGVG